MLVAFDISYINNIKSGGTNELFESLQREIHVVWRSAVRFTNLLCWTLILMVTIFQTPIIYRGFQVWVFYFQYFVKAETLVTEPG